MEESAPQAEATYRATQDRSKSGKFGATIIVRAPEEIDQATVVMCRNFGGVVWVNYTPLRCTGKQHESELVISFGNAFSSQEIAEETARTLIALLRSGLTCTLRATRLEMWTYKMYPIEPVSLVEEAVTHLPRVRGWLLGIRPINFMVRLMSTITEITTRRIYERYLRDARRRQ